MTQHQLTECNDTHSRDCTGLILYHRPGCRDVARWQQRNFGAHVYDVTVDVDETSTVESIERELAYVYNADFASDYDLTPEEYVDQGDGYRMRLMPCAVDHLGL